MSSGGGPPPPDYQAQAREQGAQERETAIFNAGVNRPDEISVGGSRRWTLRPGADPKNPQPGDYIVTTSLSPEQQRLYDSTTRISQEMLNVGEEGLGRVGQQMGRDFNPQTVAWAQAAPSTTSARVDPDSGRIQSSLNLGGMQNLVGGSDESRRRVEQALMARQSPALKQREEEMRARMAASGINIGSEASDAELRNMNMARNDAEMAAILAGGQEESRMADLARQNRAQQFGERVGAGSFANAAQAQQFGQDQGRTQLQMQLDQLRSQLGINAGTFNNQMRQQQIAEAMMRRQFPMNEINALRSGAQLQAPNFQAFYTGGQANAAPIFEASMAAGNAAQQRYAQEQASENALWGMGASTAASIAAAAII